MFRKSTPWASISDIMSGLMMVFLFISVSYAYIVAEQSKKLQEQSEQLIEQNREITTLVSEWEDYNRLIYEDLNHEFADQLLAWNAEIEPDTLSIRFKNPELLFKAGRSDISPQFEAILRDFWPRYIRVLKEYDSVIREVRIEGHTSSEWATVTEEESYFRNMALSQSRTRAALQVCYGFTPTGLLSWTRGNVTANGMSFSKLIFNEDGSENASQSRRVEFTVVIDSYTKLKEISEEL
jgi:outer membrane protein OmpA-like peptidoglycan-associated protein